MNITTSLASLIKLGFKFGNIFTFNLNLILRDHNSSFWPPPLPYLLCQKLKKLWQNTDENLAWSCSIIHKRSALVAFDNSWSFICKLLLSGFLCFNSEKLNRLKKKNVIKNQQHLKKNVRKKRNHFLRFRNEIFVIKDKEGIFFLQNGHLISRGPLLNLIAVASFLLIS